jgi:eukaryotic-like serine/threonine-protein kinase
MTSTQSPRTAQEAIELVVRSGLLTSDRLESYRIAIGKGVINTPEELLERLQASTLLTAFQARMLLRGSWKGFFVKEKFKILDSLGKGGMGVVLLCEHLILNKLVAIKMLHQEAINAPGTIERFFREGRAAASLDHPNVVRVLDVDRVGTHPFMVMEFIDGRNLHEIVRASGPMAVSRAANIIYQAALGLAQANRIGLVHRDIKPGNLLLDRQGIVKILDLGLARFHDTVKNNNLTQKFDENSILGTIDFIAPEQTITNRVDIRADLYSLGLTFDFLLRGRVAIPDGTSSQKLVWHQLQDPDPISNARDDVPDDLVQVLQKLVRKKPEDRFQSPEELMAALRPWSDQIHVPADEEMPRVRHDTFRLGIVDAPAPTTLRPDIANAATNASGLDRSDSIQAAVSDQIFTANIRSGSSNPHLGLIATERGVAALSSRIAIQSSQLPLDLAHPAHRPRQSRVIRRAIIAGVAMFAIIGIGVGFGIGFGSASRKQSTEKEVVASKSESTIRTMPTASGVSLRAGGSTFIAPLMQHWSKQYERSGSHPVDYQGIASTKGVSGMTDELIDFGCTDAPMNDEQLGKAMKVRGEVLHIPLVMGAVVPTYNLPEINERLRFTGPLLADIFLGKITKWNDPAITVNNPGLKLPEQKIEVVRRSDGSGTTYIWTDYLSRASSSWKNKVGTANSVVWPLGTEAKGNDGVATAVTRIPGAIGYVELGFALANNLPAGAVKNREGFFVEPNLESVTSAAAAALDTIPNDLRFSLTDMPGQTSFPLVGTTWAVLYANQPAGKGKAIAEFLRWSIRDGQALAKDLQYAPLPVELRERVELRINRISGAN